MASAPSNSTWVSLNKLGGVKVREGWHPGEPWVFLVEKSPKKNGSDFVMTKTMIQKELFQGLG